MSDVRVRLAPSPTGPPHLGTAYTALFNLAFARKHGGRMVLRIEDTDRRRSRREYENRLIEALRWLGLEWDEGPDVGGNFGPYRQSERMEIYQKHAQQLVDAGHAYYCYCTPERLDALRSEQKRQKQKLGYDGHCRDLGSDAAGRDQPRDSPYVIRMKVPAQGTMVIDDSLRGEIEFDFANLDDQVILKSDGFPTYHLAVVVDDHLMDITHVIRGEDWINSSPKHWLLYRYFGWEPPEHTHLPLLLNPDGSKMSKRRNPTSVEYYRKAGYWGPALRNYLGLMNCASPGEEEKFSFAEMVEQFSIGRIRLGGAIFDLQKLDWLNGRYLREDMAPESLLQGMKKWLLNDDYLSRIVPLMQPRMDTFGDFMVRCAFFFARQVTFEAQDLVPKKRTPEEVVQVLQTVLWSLEELDSWERDLVESAIRRVAEFWSWPIRDITSPLFTAVMGQRVGPPLYESTALLGIDLTRARLLQAIEALGGISKKKAARLEKEWNSSRR